MIKKRWKRVVLTLGLIIATAHLYLTLFAVQERSYVREGRRLDSYVIQGTTAGQTFNLLKVTTKVTRVVAMDNDKNIFYKLNQKQLTTRNPNLTSPAIDVSSNKSKIQHTTQTTSSNVTQILIIAYIRSGSSMTGDILQQDPDSFYVYEPLHFTEKMGKKLQSVQLLNGKFVTIERKLFFNRAFTIFNSYFDCDFSKLDFGTLVHGFQTFGNKTNKFIKCYVRKVGQSINKKLATQLCAVELEKMCQNSKYRTIKTIRLPMQYVEIYLKRYPRLKVIHLVRDPRAQVNSIVSLSNTTRYNVGFAKQKCRAMEGDHYFSEVYRTRYPGRIKRLYYEDLASSPIKTSKSLYDFTGMNFTSAVRNYITGITSMGLHSCAICSKRANSSEHVEKWRLKLTFSDVHLIDKECKSVYEHYRFLPVQKEKDLSDLSIPLRRTN
ncbi:carbohydrate sulfotransferase 1-like isoform X2 [Saccostrea echinata]|nr:carbohydrate sulfotransferase 1-like isoform X2 [Saccostrea echinata]XP_061193460.1 carbohydrate sulfotransferase 1-like isoform X2 [Saccostrea echinata]